MANILKGRGRAVPAPSDELHSTLPTVAEGPQSFDGPKPALAHRRPSMVDAMRREGRRHRFNTAAREHHSACKHGSRSGGISVSAASSNRSMLARNGYAFIASNTGGYS
jgi:hypothetical protein